MAWARSPITTTLRSLAASVDFKAGYMPGHSDGVSYLIGMMGREAGYSERTCKLLELSALLHDLGKIRLPDSILLAERKLTPEEFELVKQHPIWSAELVHGFADADGLVECELWVRHHHEHFDGSGYPDGLVGEDIPWPSRMLLVADAFHVMTTDRPYQRSRTRRDALGELYAGAGTQFCPSAVNLLHARGVWVPSHPELAAPPVLVAGAPPKE